MGQASGVRRRVPVGKLRPGDHACLLFASEEERVSVLRGFLTGGLWAAHKILYLVGRDGPYSAHELMRRHQIADAAVGARGQVEIVDVAQLCPDSGQFDTDLMRSRLRTACDRARLQGYRTLRIAGDPGGAPPHDAYDRDRLLRYEALLAEEFRTQDTLTVCQYDLRRCDDEAADAVESAHPWSVEVDPLVQTAELIVVRTYRPPGLRIEGVVDAAAHRHLREALQTIAAVRGDVRLDMSRVEFLDLGGLRLLMAFARARAARHYSVELTALPPHLLQVITLVGWDRTPGLRLAATHAC
ncbi:MEDS domain-containing protein [Streptomyces sp. NPDC050617]|uniref:MEDS domain-containing protein n=1 Tax=Streptomyces sp. NPDC050617 TaxID=3154628 RepID=UPI00342D82D7